MKLKKPNLTRLGLALLLALSAAPAVRADYSSTVLSQGPVGYWRLNETTLPLANAVTPNFGTTGTNANGKYVSSPSHQLAGPFPGSLAVGFDGVSQYVTTPTLPDLNHTNAFSLEFWLKPSVGSNSAVTYVAASTDFAANRSGWYLAQDLGNGSTFGLGNSFVFRLFNKNSSVGAVTLGTPVPPAGTWCHLVFTYDGTNAFLYKNGVLSTNYPVPSYFGNANATYPFTVGARNTLNFFWAGQAAETAIYTNALTAGKVSTHYSTATTSPANYAATILSDLPVLYHRYQEASDVVSANIGSLGSAANAKYQYGTTPGATGPIPSTYPGFESTNYAVNIDGTTTASVAVPALNLNTNTVTISGWVKASGSQNLAAGIFLSDTANTVSGLTIDTVNGGLGLGYVWNNNDPNTYNWSPSGDSGLPTLNDGEWDFVALVISPNAASIYICSPTIPFSSVTNTLIHANAKFEGSTLFGSDGGFAGYTFNGGLDEVAIWKRSLSAGELYSQYAASVGGLAPKILVDLDTPFQPVIGDPLKLYVDVGGTPDLSYQWYKTTGPIAGATNISLVFANPQATDSDTYYLVVTNLFGTVTSASAAVTFIPPVQPAIVTSPADHVLYPGGTLNLSVVATGGGLKYQWKKGTNAISGADTSTYIVPSVATNNAGSYSVVITNIVGSVTSSVALIKIYAPSNAYETAIVADAPEAWFRLNETSGTTMYDSMGRHDGTYTNVSGGPVTFGASGAITGSADTSVTFSALDRSYGIVPFSGLLNSDRFAIEAWVKTSDVTSQRCPVSSHSSVPTGYYLQTYPLGSWSGGVSSSGNNYYVPSTTAGDAIVPGQWKHVVMTYDGSLRVYVNGQYDGNGYVNFDRNLSAPFIIGARGQGNNPVDELFDGQVDEVLVYTNALTLAQAQNHYSKAVFANPIPPFFLLSPVSYEVASNASATVSLIGSADGPLPITYQWYKNGSAISGGTNATLTMSDTYSNAGSYVLRAINLNGFTNSVAATFAVLPPTPSYVNVTNGLVLHLSFDSNYADSSGHNNNGTATGTSGGLPSLVSGRLGGGALHYETITDTGIPYNLNTNAVVTQSSYVTLGNPADLQFGSATDFSVSYWARLPVGYTNGDLPFLCSSVRSFGGQGLTFAPAYTNGGWSFSYNGSVQLEGPAATINDGSWHHLVHSVNRTGYAYTYLDGSLVDSRLATSIGNLNNAGPINIGQDTTGIYNEAGSADIDDLAIWRRALTAYESYSIYYAATNSNSSFNVPGTVALGISTVGTNIVLTWSPGATLGTLLQATNLSGPWTSAGAYTPVFQVPPSVGQKFFRLSFSE